MAKLNEVFSGSYLKAEDLKGRNCSVTIESADIKEFDDGKKVILSFKGKSLALVANKTNCAIIQELTGSDDTDDWIGHTIVLTVKKVEFSGRLVPAIRVMLEPPQAAPQRPAPQPQRPAPRPSAPPPDDAGDNDSGDLAPDDVPF